jgi:hypothetical protein
MHAHHEVRRRDAAAARNAARAPAPGTSGAVTATFVALFTFSSFAACATDEGSERDIAAIPGAPREIGPTPMLSLGVVEGDTLQEFHRVMTPFRLPDGSVAVPLSGAGTIRIFDGDGAYVQSLGRPGAGPGEFRLLIGAWPRGDTIEALDFRLRRITRFLPDDRIETVSLQSDLPDLSTPLGPLGDGWAIAGLAHGGPGRRDLTVVHRFSRDGADLGVVGSAHGLARYAGSGYSGPEPLSPRALFAGTAEHVYIAASDDAVIRVHDASGAPVRQITWLPEPAASTAATFRAVVDSAVARAPPERAVGIRQRLDEAPTPDRLSVFWRLLVDSEGFIWIRPYDPMQHAIALGGSVGPGGRWRIVSPDGDDVGAIDLPADVEPLHITRDAVVGIARDELGVEYVRAYTLTRW